MNVVVLTHTITLLQKDCGPETIVKMWDWAMEQNIILTYEFSPTQDRRPGLEPPLQVYWHFKNEKDKIAFSIFFSLGV